MKSDQLAYIGANVRVLRKRAGLTLLALAKRLGVQPAALSNIERGVHAPSARVTAGLARTLNVPVAAIFARTPEALSLWIERAEVRPFRIETPGAIVSPRDLERCRHLIEDTLQLEDLCGAAKQADIPLHVPVRRTAAGMERLARQVREFMRIGHAVVFDYYELFESFGFRVLVLPLRRETDSLVFYDPGNYNAFFFINNRHNPEKQIFRLASELGRIYLLSARLHRPQDDAAPGDLDDRHAADKFAALFLMPAEAVRATVRQLGIAPDRWSYELLLRIKHRFGVSAEAFLYRLNELELIAPDAATALKPQILSHYMETGYGEPDNSRRLLTPNGRLWDLILTAGRRPDHAPALATVMDHLRDYAVAKV